MVTLFLDGDHLYGVDGKGELRCVKIATGEQLWTTHASTTRPRPGLTLGVRVSGQTLGDRFFLASETGDLVIARLTPEKYEELSRTHVMEPTSTAFGRLVWWSHPAFAGRCLFARNDKELVCVSLAAEEGK